MINLARLVRQVPEADLADKTNTSGHSPPSRLLGIVFAFGGWQLSVRILEHDIHAHELGEIPRAHSLHHPRSMIFDRAKADAQALCNFLI